MKRLLALLALIGVGWISPSAGAEIRQADVMYLDEIHAKPFPLKTRWRTRLTVSPDPSTTLAMLEAGQTVWVLGVGESLLYVETHIRTGPAKGWVDTEAVEPLPQAFLEEMTERTRIARRHKELIARGEIETGMTRAQVQAALGKPDERTRTREGDQVEEQWVYRAYKTVPQREYYVVDGKLFERSFYKKVPAGGKTILFRNEQVVAIKEEEKSPEASQPTIVLPPPVRYSY